MSASDPKINDPAVDYDQQQAAYRKSFAQGVREAYPDAKSYLADTFVFDKTGLTGVEGCSDHGDYDQAVANYDQP